VLVNCPAAGQPAHGSGGGGGGPGAGGGGGGGGGGAGGAAGVTELEAALALETTPYGVVAVIVKVYAVPLVKPVKSIGDTPVFVNP
jgi:hypothetical protein